MRRAAIGDEQIIDGVEGDGRAQQTFDLVQKIRGNVRRYPDGWGEAAPLTGLLYCADCGGKMYVHRTNNGRLHQNYLKRKASGAQKRYEDKIKERKKAEIEAEKAGIRAEDIAKGVFVPVSSLPQREPMKGVQTA